MSEFLEPTIFPEDRTPDGMAVVFDDEDLCFKVVANKAAALHLRPALAPSSVEIENGVTPDYTVIPDTESIVFGLEAAKSARNKLQSVTSSLKEGTVVRDRYERVERALASMIGLIERPEDDPTRPQHDTAEPARSPEYSTSA
jgi:hypothetical protein